MVTLSKIAARLKTPDAGSPASYDQLKRREHFSDITLY